MATLWISVLVLACGRTTDPESPPDEVGGSSSGGASAGNEGSGATGNGASDGTGANGGKGTGGGVSADGGSADAGHADGGKGGDPHSAGGAGGDTSSQDRVQVHSIEEWENGVPVGLNPASCSFGHAYYSQSECRIVLLCPNIELQIVASCVVEAGNGSGGERDDADGRRSDRSCACVYVSGSSDEVIAEAYFSGDGLEPCIATAESCVLL